MAYPTIEKIREALDYNPETGLFTRRATSNPNPRAQAGMIAGSPYTNGYIGVRVGKQRILAHRLAWAYVTGQWPDKDIDHKNGVKDDNRFENLRLATVAQNMANTGISSNNKSGVKGVIWDKLNKRWMAYMHEDGKFKNLGRYDTIEAAAAVRQEAHRKAFGDFVRVP